MRPALRTPRVSFGASELALSLRFRTKEPARRGRRAGSSFVPLPRPPERPTETHAKRLGDRRPAALLGALRFLSPRRARHPRRGRRGTHLHLGVLRADGGLRAASHATRHRPRSLLITWVRVSTSSRERISGRPGFGHPRTGRTRRIESQGPDLAPGSNGTPRAKDSFHRWVFLVAVA